MRPRSRRPEKGVFFPRLLKEEPSTVHEPQPHHDRHGGLEAMEPVRAGGLGAHVVRSMVGGDRIDHAFGQRLPQRLAIVDRSQRWIDGPLRAQGRHVPRRQREVVRRRLRRHQQPVLLRGPDQLDAGTSADVLDVQAGTGDRLQGLECLSYRPGFGFGSTAKPLNLRMHQYRQPGLGRRRERATQDDLAHQMAPVVGEGDRAGPL